MKFDWSTFQTLTVKMNISSLSCLLVLCALTHTGSTSLASPGAPPPCVPGAPVVLVPCAAVSPPTGPWTHRSPCPAQCQRCWGTAPKSSWCVAAPLRACGSLTRSYQYPADLSIHHTCRLEKHFVRVYFYKDGQKIDYNNSIQPSSILPNLQV